MRTFFGGLTVLLLAAIAYLLYVNYANAHAPLGTSLDQPSDALPLPAPAPAPAPDPALAPIPLLPAQPVQPPQSAPIPLPPPALPAQPNPAQAEPLASETPGKRTHVVQSGESLWTIAEEYYGSGSGHARIAAANHLRGDRIRVGQVLVIPSAPAPKSARRGSASAGTKPDLSAEAGAASRKNSHSGDSGEDARASASDDHEQSSAAFTPMPPTLSAKWPKRSSTDRESISRQNR